jgi:hypothetical protein
MKKIFKAIYNGLGYDTFSRVFAVIGICILVCAVYLVFRLKGWV